MVFKKIEVYGFKSFADKLEVDFSGGVTCIVGPNGCGKSNVSDAVRWVLGEQSSRALRGTNMQDVIFKGTERRNQLGYCEVSLFFDNANQLFPVDFSEVVISRKLYRSGESEYFINKKNARLKDINNLLHDSGIDRDGLTIISQGQVGEIINSKPETRRGIFEEAAGIAKFKARKVEAERKLEAVQLDLTRVTDVITEIERNLGPLLRQAAAAEKYVTLRERLKTLEINAYITQYDSAAEVKALLNNELLEIHNQLEQMQFDISQAATDSTAAMDTLAAIDKHAETMREQVLQLSLGLERHKGDAKLVQEKLEILGQQEGDIRTELNLLTRQLDEERTRQAEAKHELMQLYERHEDLSHQLAAANQDCVSTAERDNAVSALNLEKERLLTKKRTIESLVESGEGFRFSVRKILEAKYKRSDVGNRVIGAVAQEIEVPKELESAIEVALGAAAQNIITHDEAGAKAMIDLLKRENFGRATFLPLTSAKVRTFTAEERREMGEVIGVASELVGYDVNIEPVIQSLLGRVVVVDGLDNAISLAKRSRYSYKIVTLDGDVIETRGSITGGSKNAQSNNFWHTNQLSAIDAEIKTIEDKIYRETNGEKTAHDAREELTAAKIESAKLDSSISATEARLNSLANTTLLLEKSVADKQNALKALNKNLDLARDMEASEDEQRLYGEAVAKLETAKAELATLDDKKEGLRARITELETQRGTLATQIAEGQHKYYKSEVALAKVDIDIEQMQQRVAEEYCLNYAGCYEFKCENFELEPALAEIADLKRAIARLGHVNLDAIEQSRESKQRYDNYSEQVADLTAAKTDLEKVISDLSAEMETKFKEDFKKINHNFGVVFRELFNGGSARLVLTDEGDWLNSGIDIIAEPPGKKLQNISLLSGGEKALTAIAILFAILKLKPMPFCLLDEIEAALDDSNVARFAQYLQKFAQTTQFIVITHRKPTMELADNLYGVTMEEKGVSKLVSVKLETYA